MHPYGLKGLSMEVVMQSYRHSHIRLPLSSSGEAIRAEVGDPGGSLPNLFVSLSSSPVVIVGRIYYVARRPEIVVPQYTPSPSPSRIIRMTRTPFACSIKVASAGSPSTQQSTIRSNFRAPHGQDYETWRHRFGRCRRESCSMRFRSCLCIIALRRLSSSMDL